MENRFGKYELLERLGGGGMAEVFKARWTGPAGFEKFLALKLILPHYSSESEFVQMFIHEATLAARLDHANIVRIQEFDKIEDRYYIAMEWVDGKDLRAVLARARSIARPLAVGEAVMIAGEAGRGLAFAHGELAPGNPEVIHRDISPHNLLLSRAGEVKITDFGIAKLASAASLTRTGTIKGKLAYMSPEQAAGEVLDKRSDLFSLGCVLWELLTGQRLFEAPNELATLESLKNGPIHAPSAHNPQVPAELDELVLQLLARDRADRCATTSEVVRRLESILAAMPDLDRATALACLNSDLFGVRAERPLTGVLSLPGPAGPGAPPAPEVEPAPPNQLPESAPEDQPIEPAGPDAPTLFVVLDGDCVEAEPEAEPDAGPEKPGIARRWLRWAWVGLPVVLLFAILVWWRGWTDGLGSPEPQATQTASPGTRLAKIQVPETKPAETQAAEPQAAEPQAAEPKPPESQSLSRPDESARSDVAVETESPDAGTRPPPTGLLNLNAIPWAKVYLGKRLLGVTPIENRSLSPGRHRLTLVNEELHIRRTVPIRIHAGQTTRELIDLRKP